MAYVTGVATSATDLKTAIINAATANGWTEVATDILNNGVSFVKLAIDTGLTIQGGTGVSGSSLTGAGPVTARFFEAPVLHLAGNTPLLSYPLTYHIHINIDPSDVMVFVNYQTEYWQWACFGVSRSLTSSPNGSYYAAECRETNPYSNHNSFGFPHSFTIYQVSRALGPFWPGCHGATTNLPCAIDLGSGLEVAKNGYSRTFGQADLITNYLPVFNLSLTPNSWNGEIVLNRMVITRQRPDKFLSFVAELPHIRICRNDNYSDGDEITIGSDVWKVYPLARKNVVNRNGVTWGNQLINHSGTLALAVRKVT